MRLVGHAGLGRARPAGAPDAASITGAGARGVTALELDVAACADALLVMHDTVVGGRAVAGMTLASLRSRLPDLLTLDEAVEAAAGLDLLLLDLKGDAVTEPLGRWLHARGDNRLAVCTDDMSALLALRHASPTTPRWRTLPWVGEGPGRRMRTAAAVIGRRRLPAALPLLAREVAATGICVDHLVLTRPLVERAHALGLLVDVWTVNDPAAARRARSLEVDLLTTDHPEAVTPVVG